MKKTFLILKSSALKSTGVHTVQQLAYRADMHVHIFESSQLEGSYLRGLLYSKQSRYLKFLSYSLLAHICLYISYFPCLITFPTSLSWKETSFKTQQVSGLLKSLLCPSQTESPTPACALSQVGCEHLRCNDVISHFYSTDNSQNILTEFLIAFNGH